MGSWGSRLQDGDCRTFIRECFKEKHADRKKEKWAEGETELRCSPNRGFQQPHGSCGIALRGVPSYKEGWGPYSDQSLNVGCPQQVRRNDLWWGRFSSAESIPKEDWQLRTTCCRTPSSQKSKSFLRHLGALSSISHSTSFKNLNSWLFSSVPLRIPPFPTHYFEANSRHHIISFVNNSVCISKNYILFLTYPRHYYYT